MDARRSPGYPPYDDLPFTVPVAGEGDVNARVEIRLGEIEASLSLVDMALSRLPPGPPAVALPGALTAKCVAAAAPTAIVPLVPVIDPFTASVAVIVWLPAVFSVALKVPVSLVRVVLAGRIAWASLLVKWTVPL